MTLKNKINLSIVIFGILIAALFIFLIYPIFLEIQKASQDFISQKNSLVILEEKAANLNKSKLLFRKITPDLEKINIFFIDPMVPVDFIRFLEKTSQDCQTSIKISPALQGKIEKEFWPSINFQISSLGSFPNFLKFLEKLESSNYLIKIQNLNITRLNEAELKSKEFERFSLGDVKTTLSLKVYTK